MSVHVMPQKPDASHRRAGLNEWLPSQGSDQPFSSPQQAFEGLETVPMIFPRRVLVHLNAKERLQLGGGAPLLHGTIMFPPGVHDVPAALANHWFLKAHGVELHSGPEAA